MGEDLHACPYYASREAVGFAQLVCAPYNIILQADMRHSMGLRLKGPLLCQSNSSLITRALCRQCVNIR